MTPDPTPVTPDPQPASEPGPDLVDLIEPAEGVPPVIEDPAAWDKAVAAIAAGDGPVAIDTERASGYRYAPRAYLVQLRRHGVGTFLIDPTALPDLRLLRPVMADAEWVVHAATQDLPCLAELGLAPTRLFDTELGSRLAGLPKVSLGAVLEHYLGVRLAKEHSAVDWSSRPLPEPWLRYAALDVELLVPLRDAVAADLAAQGKTAWAQEEFDHVAHFTAPERHTDPWRRTSGMHRVRNRRAAGVVRELWHTRDRIAQSRDVSPSRVLPDATLIDLAMRAPRAAASLSPGKAVEAGRTRQRRADQGLKRHREHWLEAIRAGAGLPEGDLPELTKRSDGPPQARAWADRDPVAAARLAQARTELTALAAQHVIPLENLLAPDTLRRVLWDPPRADDGGPPDEAEVDAALGGHGARGWQRGLTVPVLTAALHDHWRS